MIAPPVLAVLRAVECGRVEWSVCLHPTSTRALVGLRGRRTAAGTRCRHRWPLPVAAVSCDQSVACASRPPPVARRMAPRFPSVSPIPPPPLSTLPACHQLWQHATVYWRQMRCSAAVDVCDWHVCVSVVVILLQFSSRNRCLQLYHWSYHAVRGQRVPVFILESNAVVRLWNRFHNVYHAFKHGVVLIYCCQHSSYPVKNVFVVSMCGWMFCALCRRVCACFDSLISMCDNV